jgi:hypothetical protein
LSNQDSWRSAGGGWLFEDGVDEEAWFALREIALDLKDGLRLKKNIITFELLQLVFLHRKQH